MSYIFTNQPSSAELYQKVDEFNNLLYHHHLAKNVGCSMLAGVVAAVAISIFGKALLLPLIPLTIGVGYIALARVNPHQYLEKIEPFTRDILENVVVVCAVALTTLHASIPNSTLLKGTAIASVVLYCITRMQARKIMKFVDFFDFLDNKSEKGKWNIKTSGANKHCIEIKEDKSSALIQYKLID